LLFDGDGSNEDLLLVEEVRKNEVSELITSRESVGGVLVGNRGGREKRVWWFL